MSEAFLAACENLSPPEYRATVVRAVSARLFDHMDKFAVAATSVFEAEKAHLSTTPAAVRAATVRSFLARPPADLHLDAVDLDTIQQRLNYSLRQIHQAAVLTFVPTLSAQPPEQLKRLGYQIARDSHARQSLIHVEGTEAWLWFGSHNQDAELDFRAVSGTDCVVSVGTPRSGLSGFRQSLDEAQQVRDLRQRALSTPTVWRFREVEIALLASVDFARAQRLVSTRLEGLLGTTRQETELRDALRVYLDSRARPNETALRLHVTRNTVSARVQKASQRLLRPLDDDTLGLHVALTLVHVFGASAFTDDH